MQGKVSRDLTQPGRSRPFVCPGRGNTAVGSATCHP